MLRQLYIRNFTLIDELNMQFHPGFSVITGETGAGKSIVLGAIGLLLGQRADLKTLKQGADRCVIEAHFDLSRYDMHDFFAQNDIDYDAQDTIVRRELTAAGKSRAFINDTPVSLALLKELGERLVDVHSQHQNLLLSKHDFQLSVVDIIAHDEAQLADYRESFAAYREANARLESLRNEIDDARKNVDFMQFQYDELAAANLQAGEQEELEQQRDTMNHAEDIKSALYTADSALSDEQGGIVGRLRQAATALRGIERMLPAAEELAARMESCHIELKDIAGEVSTMVGDVDFDPAELDRIEQRLDRLYELEKKYRVETVDALIAERERLGEELTKVENGDEALQAQTTLCEQLRQTCGKKADVLTRLRQKAAKTIEQALRERLVPLGMPKVRFEIKIESRQLSAEGQDSVSFLFSANTSTALQSVSEVASGGEIARVMLSLKAMISGAVKLPTIIFDEIDTGVSGKIAEQMAAMMAEMGAQDRQVISITHLPQIAARGTTHYKVYKEETAQGTATRMLMLSDEERVGEIAQMLSGSSVSAAAIENAKVLLKKK